MLEYTKIILQKVCFDSHLFYKELTKAVYHLDSNDLSKLYTWCLESFGDQYPETIHSAFGNWEN